MAITLKSPTEIAYMREGGLRLARIMNAVKAAARAGIHTEALNQYMLEECRKEGVIPSCVGYYGYPAGICTSVNDQVVHCIPSNEVVLRDGDIVKLDFVAGYQGFHTDACFTVAIGAVDEEAERLMQTTYEALYIGIAQAKEGNTIGDISSAIQAHVEVEGYNPVRETCGHGIGTKLHEDPDVPNYGRAGKGPLLRVGMTICIEPIIAAGNHAILTEKDGWTTRTKDGSLAAHYEHTVLITEVGPEILTPWDVDAEEMLRKARAGALG